MTTKLLNANLGIILVVEKDGRQEKKQFSVTCPSESAPNLVFALGELIDFVNKEFGSHLYVTGVSGVVQKVAKPKRIIKAPRPVSQNEFNKRIKELGYKP